MQMNALRSANFLKLSSSSSTSDAILRGIDVGGHAGWIVLEPDALHGFLSDVSCPLFARGLPAAFPANIGRRRARQAGGVANEAKAVARLDGPGCARAACSAGLLALAELCFRLCDGLQPLSLVPACRRRRLGRSWACRRLRAPRTLAFRQALRPRSRLAPACAVRHRLRRRGFASGLAAPAVSGFFSGLAVGLTAASASLAASGLLARRPGSPVGVGSDGSDQAQPGRASARCRRPLARGRCRRHRQHFRRLHGCCGGRSCRTARSSAPAESCTGADCDVVVVRVFNARPLALAAPHVVAQIRRRGRDRLQLVDEPSDGVSQTARCR